MQRDLFSFWCLLGEVCFEVTEGLDEGVGIRDVQRNNFLRNVTHS